MNNYLGWKHALGIGFDVPPEGQRSRDSGNGPYTELMQKYELWLRDTKGYSSHTQFDFETGKKLRWNFFVEHVESHPEWFSTAGLERLDVIHKNGHGHMYRCKGCSISVDGSYLETCCN